MIKIKKIFVMVRQDGKGCQWLPDRVRQVYQLSLLGLTEKDMAKVMGVSVASLAQWKLNHPEFQEALTKGKDLADANVAEALYKRACGFWVEWEEEKWFKGVVTVLHNRRYFPPDSWAAARWLALRQRGTWTEITKIETTQTNINITKIDLTGFNFDELKLIEKMGLKQLTENAGSN
jgi:transcriptional regulator with XRE-family HTH domain